MTGADDAAGDSPEAALRTIQRALDLAGPGERIYVSPGVYPEELIFDRTIDPAAPIVLTGEPGASVLDGGHVRAAGFWCEACRGLVLEDLVVRNYSDVGVAIVYASDVALRRLEVHDNGFAPQQVDWEFEGYGVYVDSSSRIEVDSIYAHHNGPNPQRPGHWVGTAVNLYACTDCVIRDSTLLSNVGAGILVEDSVDVVVERNEISDHNLDVTWDGWWDGAVWLDGGRDVTLRQNFVHDNYGPGFQISDEEGQSPRGYVLEGNVSTANLIGLYLWNFGTDELPGEPILRVVDNDFSGNLWVDVFVAPEFALPMAP
jgi:hypothetical protein